ncbi:MAG: hypothetical protein L0Y72_22290 [Gemmataceae bacterium]|nr:hypothetical protein [Gemmataceae bacterium]MCI0741772.1 hypothetical protein [Gemmataceae bacterium]
MMKTEKKVIGFLCAFSVSLCLCGDALASEPTPDAVRAAVTKALPLIQKGAVGHREQRTCFACHNQAIPILALTTARSRGFEIDEDELRQQLKFIHVFLDRNRESYRQGKGQGGQADTAGYALWTLELGGWKRDATLEAVAEYLLLHHQDLDHWRATSNRPPTEASAFTTTYLSLRGLQSAGTTEQQERIERRLKQVRAWLTRTRAKDTEDRVFRLLALKHVGAHPAEWQKAAQELIAKQRDDGGWAQLDSMESDAYATGSVLVAMYDAAGLATSDPVYQSGLRYLLDAQLDDGSWYVKSRSKPFQTYYESGFPHGHDQFISIAASGWATTALVLSLPESKRDPTRR